MEILIISDTHTDTIEKLPNVIIDKIKSADALIHCGDITGVTLLKQLSRLNSVFYPVKGNLDPYIPEVLPEKRHLIFEGVKVGVTHGSGSPFGLEMRLFYSFHDEDIIVYGHTHSPFAEEINGKFFLNPGSLVENRYITQNSYAVLKIKNKKYEAKIIYL